MNSTIPYMDKIIPIIISIASPDQIILFGSYARGDSTANNQGMRSKQGKLDIRETMWQTRLGGGTRTKACLKSWLFWIEAHRFYVIVCIINEGCLTYGELCAIILKFLKITIDKKTKIINN